MEVNNITVEPYRFLPFDVGCELSDKLLNELKRTLSQNYRVLELSERQKAVLPSDFIYAILNENVELYLFNTGIGVFIIKESSTQYKGEMLFSAKYLRDRKNAHNELLNWRHPISPLIKTTILQLREYVKTKVKKLRKSASEEWEYKEISYVMSIAFFHLPAIGKEKIAYDNLPPYLQKGIPGILNPSYFRLNDSLTLSQNAALDDATILALLDDIEETPVDYELRKHIMCFMSWASVLIVGNNINQTDKEEWALLEVKLQHYWYYIYCSNYDITENEYTIEQILTKKMEAEKIKDDIKFLNDSSMPERFEPIVEGLAHTSSIMKLIDRYIRQLNYTESMITAQQEQKKRYWIQTAEIILFAVAFLQVAPTLYDFFKNPTISSIKAVIILICLFIFCTWLLVRGNRYK